MKKNKVLLIGWDAADWKIISPLVDSGQMPALKKLIEEGVIGNIATMDPPLSPMLWTSIATGMTADKHGILGFAEPDPSTGKIRPVSVTSRKVKAVWNILMQNGLKTHCVGWWPGHPAEPLNGVSVSNFFVPGKAGADAQKDVSEYAVHPPELREIISSLRVDMNEITAAHILPFVPLAAQVDQEKDVGLQSIANLLAKGASYHSVATWILENQEWDFLALYLNEIDVFCHTFMKFTAPKLDNVSQEMFDIYNDVVNSAYRFHDMMLERLIELAGEDTTIILLSDHGFHSGEQRKIHMPDDPAAPAIEHAQYGVFCMKGPGIKKDERIYGATLLDVAPTILSLFGLPAGQDMQGKVLYSAFEDPRQIARIPSWETVAGNSGQHPGEMREDPWAAQQALAQLVELGYMEAPGEDEAKNAERVVREAQFYLARVYLTTNRPKEALPVLQKIVAEAPEILRYGIQLVNCCIRLSDALAARAALDSVRAKARVEGADAHLDYLEGIILLAEHKPRKALEHLFRAEKGISNGVNVCIQIGQTYVRLKMWEDAERAFTKALAIDSENARAHHGLALASLRQNKLEIAIDEALTAVGQLHNFPAAHYHLGEALLRYGDYANAVKAFSTALALKPGLRKAHFWLADIFKNHLPDAGREKYHRDILNSNFMETIYVVSGLPRSGTSMMMQMLKAGGLEVVADGIREGDTNNPNGYLEDERVKRLHLDHAWMKEAANKAVKVVVPLVMNLPTGFRYKVIFMQRPMEEVLTSQQVMLGRKQESAAQTYPAALVEAFSKQLEKTKVWFDSQPQIEVLAVNYSDVIDSPRESAETIISFLDLELNAAEMAASVNASLYRNRKKN